MNSMGITDNVLALAHNVGLAMLFQANHLSYKALTLEFSSTVEVERYNGVPTHMTFQLHNQQYTMTSDELSLLLGGPARGAYLGNHTVDYHNTWGLIAPRENSAYAKFVPGSAKVSSIRNPTFRYFHRLLSTGLLSRQDDGTVQSNEVHIIWATWNRQPQSLGCYLMDHFHTQARAHQKISVGGIITPIANHFGIQINEPPISTDILLDKKAMRQRQMLFNVNSPIVAMDNPSSKREVHFSFGQCRAHQHHG